ncbi:MAG: hypothetical protein ACI37O_02505 [Candidatus Avelusimicrobium sp.]|uniref:hypothetical protein n=1 Tax=Candidatus Avelusimicrobium sp. TaxID=3048833 RepID=UPI003F00D9FF
MPYIISSLTADHRYAFYEKTSGNVLRVKKEILIKGGANVANKKTLLTPSGAVTEVSERDLELLKTNISFKNHLERGFLKIMETSNKYKAEETAEKMDAKDKSAQRTPEDYEKEGKKAPRTRKGK